MKININGLIIFCCSILIISCGDDLSRSKAERLIDSFPKFSIVKIRMPLNMGGFEKGIRQEKWNTVGHVTSSGQSDFKQVEFTFLELAKPLNVALEVTGITDTPLMQGVKEVQFSWKYQNIPSTVKRFIVEGGTGQAYLRKYDDGWRVEDIIIKYSQVAVRQEPQEIEQEQKEEAALEGARRVQAEHLQTILQKAKTRTRNIGQFEYSTPSTGGTLYTTIVVSDVDIVENTIDRSMIGSKSGSESYWFGDIVNLETEDKLNERSCQHILRVWLRTSGKNAGHTLCSNDKSKRDNLYAVLSRAVDDWRKNNSEVVQKNLR